MNDFTPITFAQFFLHFVQQRSLRSYTRNNYAHHSLKTSCVTPKPKMYIQNKSLTPTLAARKESLEAEWFQEPPHVNTHAHIRKKRPPPEGTSKSCGLHCCRPVCCLYNICVNRVFHRLLFRCIPADRIYAFNVCVLRREPTNGYPSRVVVFV